MSEKEDIIKSFTVHVPVELIKSEGTVSDDESEDSWKIGGIASTEDVDLQGEEVIQDGLDISVLKAGRGIFNHDHQKGPENVLGQIDDANFIKHNGKTCLDVKGYLFKAQPRAQAYYNIMKSVRKGSSPRVHFSIEGKVVERDMTNTNKIRKARVTKVALTLDPVNPHTFADLVKSISDYNQNAIEETNSPKQTISDIVEFDITTDLKDELTKAIQNLVEKALAAGAGYGKAPSSRTGGEAMSTESLDSKAKKMFAKKLKRSKKTNKYMLKSLIEAVVESHPECDPLEVAEMICKSYELKLKEFLNVN